MSFYRVSPGTYRLSRDCAPATAGTSNTNSSAISASLNRSGVCVGKRCGALLGEPLAVLLPAGEVGRTLVRIGRRRGDVFERTPVSVGPAVEQPLVEFQIFLAIALPVV